MSGLFLVQRSANVFRPMSFKILSMILGLLCLAKGVIALIIPARFYERRRQQYSSERMPIGLRIIPFIVLTFVCFCWYATLFHYVKWGWVVTAFVTAVAALSLENTFKWSRHRIRMLKAIDYAENYRRVDVCIAVLGVCFLFLAFFIYPS